MELKNGVTFNGHLVDCDNYMNVTLREVYQTSADGESFWKMKEMFIKGNFVGGPPPFPLIIEHDEGFRRHHLLTRVCQIKYFRIADAILDTAMEEQEKARAAGRQRGGGRGGWFLVGSALGSKWLTDDDTGGARGQPNARGAGKAGAKGR